MSAFVPIAAVPRANAPNASSHSEIRAQYCCVSAHDTFPSSAVAMSLSGIQGTARVEVGQLVQPHSLDSICDHVRQVRGATFFFELFDSVIQAKKTGALRCVYTVHARSVVRSCWCSCRYRERFCLRDGVASTHNQFARLDRQLCHLSR